MEKLIIILILISSDAFSQQSSLSEKVNEITEFVSSDYFFHLSSCNNDLALVDSIYLHALKINNYDFSEALLSLTFSLIPYKEVPIQIPLINSVIKFPLIAHNDSVFYNKNRNLPKNLFYDSPQNEFGDKDKLSHFFGNAFIGYHSTFFDLGSLFGYFVEVFEEDFKVQSAVDERDLKVNELGNIFGKILKENKNVLPSQIMIAASIKYFIYNFP